MHHFPFSHEAGGISGSRSQICTLEKPSTKLRWSGWGCVPMIQDTRLTGQWGEDTQNRGFYNSEFKSPIFQHHSLCSILTFGGLRKDLFFFSLVFLPLAWKVLQLSTRPSLVSWRKTKKERKKKPLWNTNGIIVFPFIQGGNHNHRGTHLKVFLPFSLSLCFLCCLDFFLPCPFPGKLRRNNPWHFDEIITIWTFK